MSTHNELESYRAEFTAFCEHMEAGLKTQYPSLTQKEVLAIIGISLFAETKKSQRDIAALQSDIEAQIQLTREAMEVAAGIEAERLKMARDSMLVLAAAILSQGGKIVVDKASMIRSISATVSRFDNHDGTFELHAAIAKDKA